MDDWFDAIRVVRVAGEKPALDPLYDDAAYVGSSFGLSKVSVKVDQKPMSLAFVALWA